MSRTPEQYEAFKAHLRHRYATDPEYRARVNAQTVQWQKDNRERKKLLQRKSDAKRIEQVRATRRRWREQNPEKIAAYAAAADKMEMRERARQYRLNNPEKRKQTTAKYRAEHRDELREYNRAYGKAHPEQNVLSAQRRRLRIKNADDGVSKDIAAKLWHLQKGRCACCKAPLPKRGFHIDHIMPLILGGAHKDANLQLLCAPCNLAKNAKHPIEFMRSRGLLL